ncbi:MAG TPA: low molecular weight phosphotyrosine protein phosphatase [Candidatus Limosilactobacillus gallistercoris]|uniref:low molecular weight protein-tyrosine-phosphatase n=1 Tax=Limosilactobacillus pontis TaxID=35787 RepID=UPI001C3A3814|nr:low molecular weight protein-tyrosine-phosphatase [Limosilactobacillus pontis]MDM8332548.1 low molecular weight protein-tyrosine-phosphatase [Limosilactobacillus pontis]HJA74451.1 low molecular weight phosphotyrosine protein phosphatase [Candidatus Limosilactobacillus gallistercoris]
MNVLFVCLGNICRSPMAEAMFKQMVEKAGLADQIYVDSAGTSDYEEGNGPHPGALKTMRRHNLPTAGLVSRPITRRDFDQADYIICMDDMNRDNLRRMAPVDDVNKIHLANEPVPGKEDTPIDDPWYTHRFEDTYQSLATALPYWLDIMKKQLRA